MNDTIRAMRACGFLLLAACSSDPSLAVTVHHPSGVSVAQTVVTVYFGDDVRCTEIMYGDRTEAELAAITADELDVTAGGRIDVSRLGGKSIVARGYDADRRFVTAGCQDVGEITAGTELEIETHATAVVAIDPGSPEKPFTGRDILVNLSDPRGAALDAMVSWQLSGPAGAPELPPAEGLPTRNGDVTIRVDDLGMPGPEGLRLRVPWATAPLPLVTAFDLSGAVLLQLGNGNNVGRPSCEVRGHAGGAPTLVCLAPPDNLQGHRDVVEIGWKDGQYTRTTRAVAGDGQFALFVDHDGSADEPVYVVGQTSWLRLGGTATTMVFPGALEAVVYVPRCADNSLSAVVGVQTSAGAGHKRQFYSVTGAADPAHPISDGEVFAGGCVGDVDHLEHQAVLVSNGTGDPALGLLSKDKDPEVIGTAKLSGAGFVAIQRGGVVEKRFAGTRLQATGTVVFESVLARAGGTYKLVERTELDCAALPTKILAGQLDHDGDTDLMWDLGTALRRHTYQVSLAKQVSGAPLTAITSGSTPSTVLAQSDFVLANLNGGAADEMIVFTAGQVAIYSAD
jgi:hypothetical protein